MCGVTIVIARDRERAELLAREFYDVLRLRGPDALSVVVKECAGVFVVLVASVLWIRGENVAKQPVEVSERGVLAWNGELFNAEALNEEAVSDTNLLVDWLQKSSPTEVIARCEGPFAITYLDEKRRKLLFARNRFGQRSLLIALPQPLSGQCISHEPDHSIGEGEIDLADDVLVISSVVPGAIQQKFAWREVPVSGVFELDLSKGLSNVRLNLALCYDPLPGARLLDLDRESACREVLQLLQRSVMKRVVSLGTSCRKVRLLFSGGVDCLLLAVYLHRCLPASAELVLRNVAFGPDFESAFDRVQARRALAELISLFPERKWQMEEVNVGEQALADVIEKVKVLTFPQTSVMDVTIGSVLWFAFGGIEKDPKVVFSGIGADELFAGYARHKSRFNRAEKDWNVLSLELKTEIERIAYRNNGRDDRICASFGRECRHPYLDENLVRFAMSVSLRCLVSFEGELCGKTVLREELKRLGFSQQCFECPKKAMQFGSRVTKTACFKHTRRGSEEY